MCKDKFFLQMGKHKRNKDAKQTETKTSHAHNGTWDGKICVAGRQ